MPGTPRCSTSRPSNSSAPSSSASPRARPNAWTRSNACCWNCAGRRWKTPPCRPTAFAALQPACSSAVAPTTTSTYQHARRAGRDRRLFQPGHLPFHSRWSHRLLPRPRRPRRATRHRVLVVAGRRPPGVPTSAQRRMRPRPGRRRQPAAFARVDDRPLPLEGPLARRPLQDVRRGGQRLRARRRLRPCSCSSGSPTPRRPATASAPCIRGSAVNQDGRSGGLTVPNELAQERLIRRALAAAGVQAGGDRLPRGAWHRHGAGRSDRDRARWGPCFRGRADAAVGRLGEDQHRAPRGGRRHGRADQGRPGLGARGHPAAPALPPAQPAYPLETLPLRVPTTLVPWPRGQRLRRAGVSSFGFSGTNAHVIVEEAPAEEDAETRRRGDAEKGDAEKNWCWCRARARRR